MSKGKKTPEGASANIPSNEEFRSAVKYYLVNDLGMPELVAEEVLCADADFVERQRNKFSADNQIIINTADSLAFEPSKGVKWVQLEEGERKASETQVIIDADGSIRKYLDCLVTLGLHGQCRDSVAKAMLARGIESVFSLIASDTK